MGHGTPFLAVVRKGVGPFNSWNWPCMKDSASGEGQPENPYPFRSLQPGMREEVEFPWTEGSRELEASWHMSHGTVTWSHLSWAGFRFVHQLKQKPALGLAVCNCIALKPPLQILPEKVKLPEWSLHNCKLNKLFLFFNAEVQAICAFSHLSRAC